MKIKVLGSYGSEGPGQRPSALLVDDRVLVDAGTVGGALSPAEQIQVEHTVLTTGFIVHDGETGFVFSGDTGPTKKIWQAAKEMRGLKAVIVETSFPNRMDALAKTSGHLTPEMLKRELDKAPPDVPVWIYHVKPQLYQETAEELAKIDSTRIHILEQGKTYTL